MFPEVETIQALAAGYRQLFETKERGDETIWVVRDEHRDANTGEVMELVAAVHENRAMLPDDYRYAFTVEALDVIAESEDPDDVAHEGSLEADFQTADLVRWLGSGLRYAYVDEAVSELGHSDLGVIGDIMAGQLLEKQEVFYVVLGFLSTQSREEQR